MHVSRESVTSEFRHTGAVKVVETDIEVLEEKNADLVSEIKIDLINPA